MRAAEQRKGVKKVKTWEEEVIKAAEAGEREFGFLDAHHTVKHNLERRCKEILEEELQPIFTEQEPGAWHSGPEL